MLFSVSHNPIKRPNPVRDEIMRFQKIQVLLTLATGTTTTGRTDIMINAHRYIFSLGLLLLHESRSQTSTPRIDHHATLLPPHRRVQAEVLPTRQAQPTEILHPAQLLFSVFHKRLQLRQRFLNLGHGTWGDHEQDSNAFGRLRHSREQ
jgi:hypothetical protein